MKRIIKWTLIAIAACGLIFSIGVISKCDYEDFCHDHGVECETETNPAVALIGGAVMAAAGFAAYQIEQREDE